MSFKITFLGTASMVPTKERNVQGIHVEYEGEGMLVDCGEGTQRQMNIAGINRVKVNKVFISHWHGDHVSGLVGLIQTIGNTTTPGSLKIFGPSGTQEKMNHLLKSCEFDLRINLEILEINPEKLTRIYESSDIEVYADKLDHTIPCIGYRFVEKDKRNVVMSKAKALGIPEGPLLGQLQKGKTIELEGKTILPESVTRIKRGKIASFILDTKICNGCFRLAENADLLVCEATFDENKREKADEYKHMTGSDAARIASQSNTKKLIITHFSQRYKEIDQILEEATNIFPETKAAFDFMTVKL